MASIKVTPGGDFDPNNSVTAVDSQILANYVPSDAYTVNFFTFKLSNYLQIYDNNKGTRDNVSYGNSYIYKTDGLLEDFSDNTGGVNLTGGDRGDILIGGSGDDTLNGGGGNDMLEGGSGTNTLDGGSGSNTVSYAAYDSFSAQTLGTGVTINLQTRTATDRVDPFIFGPATNDTLTNIQNVIGSAYDDILIGTTGNSLQGGDGDDILRIQGTPTLVDGGNGNDTLSVTKTATLTDTNFADIERIVVYGGAKLDMSSVSAGAAPAQIRSQSTVKTSATIIGTQGADHIAAGKGSDSIDGGLGKDVITTGSGRTTIVNDGGGDGNDVIFASAGSFDFQAFMGGIGHDVIRGAAANIANETFEFGDDFGSQLSDLHFNQNAAGNTVITGVDGMKAGSITLVGVTSDQAQTAHYLFSAQSS